MFLNVARQLEPWKAKVRVRCGGAEHFEAYSLIFERAAMSIETKDELYVY